MVEKNLFVKKKETFFTMAKKNVCNYLIYLFIVHNDK